jgi:hypothetical protein
MRSWPSVRSPAPGAGDEVAFRLPIDPYLEALQMERFALLAMAQVGPVAIEFAARHPEDPPPRFHVLFYSRNAFRSLLLSSLPPQISGHGRGRRAG